jgi:phosphoglycolate phosphatase-like HAD superfamily hydrolase
VDTAIAVALVTGGLGTVGAIGNIVERMTSSRSSARGEDSRLGLDRDIQTSADLKWMVGELKDQIAARKTEYADEKAKLEGERDDAKSKLSELRTDHESLQRLYREALEHIESLEMKEQRGVDE